MDDMALTINIYYTGDGDSAILFAREMISTGVAERIRKQPGNRQYEYFLPLENTGSVLLIDSWTDQEALDRHHKSPMMQEIAHLRVKYGIHMKVERYIPDEGGIPEEDVKYITD